MSPHTKLAGLVLAAGFVDPRFADHSRAFETTFTWDFDAQKIKKGEVVISVEGIIFAHAKKKTQVASAFIKTLKDKVFDYDGETFGIQAQMW